jgi:hypothetical protein
MTALITDFFRDAGPPQADDPAPSDFLPRECACFGDITEVMRRVEKCPVRKAICHPEDKKMAVKSIECRWY